MTASVAVAVLLQSEHVVLVVDTNILVEFLSIERLPWRELAPNARSIRLVVPMSVVEEMDHHKKKTGRLRRRGIEFNKLMRAIEDSPDERAIVRSADPVITVEPGRILRRSELDGDLYDLDDPDGRIVAEFARIASSEPTAILIADDGKPIRLARQTGLAHVRPPAHWRSPEGPDERDTLISQLKGELGAQPLVTIGFPDATEIADRRRLTVLVAPERLCDHCAQALFNTVLRVDCKTSRSTLEMRYPHAMRGALNFGSAFQMPMVGRVTAQDLDDYESAYRVFVERVRRWALTLPQIMDSRGSLLTTTITVGNDGERTADRVQVEAELSGDFHFEPLDMMDLLLEDVLAPPDEPVDFPSIDTPLDLGHSREPRRPDIMYALDEPSIALPSKRISWRAEELRQGARFDLPVMIAADRAGAAGVLKVTARGADIAKPCVGSVALKVSDQRYVGSFADFISPRLHVVPEKYRKALAREIAAPTRDCSC